MSEATERGPGVPPDGVTALAHDKQLMKNLDDAIDAKNDADERDLREIADEG